MFSSTKIGNSPCTNNTSLYNNINETANGISRNFIQPKITSTPLVKRESIFATPPKHSILSPRRYSLSEIATPPRSNRRDLSKVVTTGPLLASTKYNVNVSTYEDTKSPGLASRIVQYNEEAEREKVQSRPPTHQAKYGSPGLFPVVHLFKKNLPTLDQKPKRVTVRIASPEYSKYHSQEYNRKLLEGIIKPSSPMNSGSPFLPSNHPSSSTRSVLDALKEISRKRIHATEDYDLNEDSGKRLRIMNSEDSNKRLRDDSSSEKSPSPGKQTSKRVCMYDEYAASCSSTNFSLKKTEQQPKRKSISISTLTENLKESKQVKLINAETQTITNETVEETNQASVNSTEETQNKNEISDEVVSQKKSPLKVFDDAPLERIRKNRLAALMGSLTGKEPVLLPKPDYASVLNSQVESSDTPDLAADIPKPSEKPLVSILSSPKKPSPTKSNKHVHFSVPESTSQTNFTATVLSFPSAPTIISVSVPASVSETNITSFTSNKISRETPAPPSSPVGLQPTSNDSSAVVPVTSFGNASNSSSTTSIVSKESSTSLLAADSSKTGFTIPNFQFKPAAVTSASLIATSSITSATQLAFSPPATSTKPLSVANSPPKMGGFKFDLSKPVTTSVAATVNSAPTFSFGSTSQSSANKSSDLNASKSTAMAGTFSFSAKAPPSTTNFSTGFSFGAVTASSVIVAPTVTTSAAPTFKFGPTSSENTATTSAGFPLAHSGAASFGITSVTPVTTLTTNTSTSQVSSATTGSGSAFGASKTPFFSFGASKTTSPSSGFGVPASTAPVVTFGAPLTTSSSFGTPASNFLNTSSSLPASGFTVATTTPSTISSGFGAPSTTSNTGFSSNPPSMFSGNKTVSPFGVSTSSSSGFGTVSTTNASPFAKSSATQFGQSTTQSAFGAPSTTTASFTASNAFGATTTTTSSVFGNANSTSVFAAKSGGFGAPSGNTNIFGGNVNTQPSGFGTTTSNPIFGLAATSPFGGATKTTTAAPSFGNTNTPSFNFGPKTTANSSFGSGNSFGTTTTASTGFGNVTTPAFGTASNSFGGSTNFGSTNNTFGVATTSNQPSGFGVTTTPSFGTANSGFNTVEKSSMFGNASSATPAFGSNTAAAPFGNSTSTPSFGPPNNAPGFGSNSAISSFAKPQPTQNAFGAPTSNAFGTNSFGATQQQTPNFGPANPSNTQSAVFSFGATSPPKPPGVFSFGVGATNEVPKPSFNFTGGSTQPPAFGSSGAPSFGNSGSAPFGATGIPQFNAPQLSTQGMFSIGSGSSSGKSRTHLKTKRRT